MSCIHDGKDAENRDFLPHHQTVTPTCIDIDETDCLNTQPTALPSWTRSVLNLIPVLLTTSLLLPYAIYLAITSQGEGNPDTLHHHQRTLLLLSGASFASSLVAMGQASPIPRFPQDTQRDTWFGHLMSLEGEWRHIPVVLCATYSFVLCYGTVASMVTGCSLLCIPAFYICGLAVFYLWHWAAHVWEGSELNRIHMDHHQNEYPQHDYYGDNHPLVQSKRMNRGGRAATLLELMNPAVSTTVTWAHEGPILLGIVGILLAARLLVGLSIGACVFILFGLSFMGSFGSAVHIGFHERDFQLEPFAWFRELRSLHMLHHMHRKNYAMVNILLDLFFCSLMIVE